MNDLPLIKADTCSQDETVHAIAIKMEEKKLRRFFVINDDKNFVGIVTSVDILNKVVAKNKESSKVKVKDIMEKKIKYVNTTDPLDKALKIMNSLKTFVCPVVKDKKLLGLISYQDIISNVVKSTRN